MNTLLHYDLIRLEAFQNNPSVRESIEISQSEDLTLLKFLPIQYFNYCYGKIDSKCVLQKVKGFYADTFQGRHQILLDSEDELSKSILAEAKEYRLFKKIAIMKLGSGDRYEDLNIEETQLVLATEENIREFAWLYLRCFEAENRHAESVEDNFLHKFQTKGIQFYFIQWNNTPIGIAGLYCSADFQILSVAAVLPEFRNNGYHQSALSQRIKMCRERMENTPIYSWAYQNSISHLNMKKLGMSLAQEIWVYQHVE
jgi:hypothetical protein